ncbi:MAG: universal stress protein [Emcibacter sp.]|nr:universal stress protein [Emcibacter sp.]HEC00094.1 universal stress protein [Sphingomonadales bacterium]
MSKKVTYIVGYDGGELSMRAAELAVDKLKVRGGGTLLLAYVVDWSEFEVMSVEELAVRHSQHMEQLESAEKDIMAPAREKLATDGITIETNVQVGHAADIISALAEEHKADQIFIGHKSSGFLAKLGLGSVAYSILQKAKVPVTVVP